MSCFCHTVICCGIKRKDVQDCVECRWLIIDQTPTIIFQSNQVVSASGTIELSSSTSGLTQVDVIFSRGTKIIETFTLEDQQCLSFTVVGFDTITLQGNATDPSESATGSFCLTPRYQI
ncbi:S-Ena type endospore appendage [Alkalihalobacillus sp. BA299]|uniref:S-Ena type endospore appendage n=1 Tax=Alkalihalobacillus sp. BA299 TaxID=2815938 RepID=UPI001ADB2F7F|nr:S-Ena type endospore appendage [Alkalihalobacillus sp. BA299]